MPILCATDFSPCSRVAARVAAGLARQSRQPIVLVHVISPAPPTLPGGLPIVPVWEDEQTALRMSELEQEANRLRAAGVAVDARLERGSPWRVLVDLAAATGAAALVVGRHGRGAVDRLVLGSCAEKIARTAACPVVVVPEQSSGLERWDSGVPPGGGPSPG